MATQPISMNIIKQVLIRLSQKESIRSIASALHYNTPRFSDRHNYGGMTRNRYICKKEENQNGKTI